MLKYKFNLISLKKNDLRQPSKAKSVHQYISTSVQIAKAKSVHQYISTSVQIAKA